MLDSILTQFATPSNPLMSMFATLMMHVGSRYLSFQLTPAQERMLKSPLVQNCILISAFYVTTRSLVMSTMMFCAYLLFIKVLFNETHQWNIVPKSYTSEMPGQSKETKKNDDDERREQEQEEDEKEEREEGKKETFVQYTNNKNKNGNDENDQIPLFAAAGIAQYSLDGSRRT